MPLQDLHFNQLEASIGERLNTLYINHSIPFLETGSQVFRCPSPDSDTDIVLNYQHLPSSFHPDLQEYKEEYKEIFDEYPWAFCNVKFAHLDFVIVPDDLEFAAWTHAHNCFINYILPVFDPNPKEFRVDIFEALKKQYRYQNQNKPPTDPDPF